MTERTRWGKFESFHGGEDPPTVIFISNVSTAGVNRRQWFRQWNISVSARCIFRRRLGSFSKGGKWRGARATLSEKGLLFVRCTICNLENLLQRQTKRQMSGNCNKMRRVYRVFRNLWHPLRELIVRLKLMKKESHKYMSCLSSFMRRNEFSVLITFTKDAKKWPPCIWRQACTRLVIDLITLSVIPGVSRICRKPLLYSIS